jgi:eukaryotic-like serine/threonine-protein kinase
VQTVPSANSPHRRTGDCLADRFTIVDVAGRGGMGTVYRATDSLTGAPVALKVLTSHTREASERFLREARVLSELAHPAVVRYLAHGITAEGEAYLAMEWLDGEDLATRVARGALSLDDTLVLVRRAAEALAPAHARGIVHRDVKPSNLFLVDNDPGRVKILDFGVARIGKTTQQLTGVGAVVGTFGYMAPEQAYESREVDTRADVYALGCVLFECLTGRAAIQGEQVVALVSKTLLEVPPHVKEFRPDVPGTLDELIARMLAKEPDERPANAMEVLRALESLGTMQGSGEARTTTGPAPVLPMGGSELQLVSVLLARLEDPSRAATMTPEQPSMLSQVQELAQRYLGKAIRLPDGTVLVKLVGGSGSAMDQAVRAAGCATELRAAHPKAVVAVATGFAETSGRLPLGEVIDRAAAMLCGHEQTITTLDGVTASLVETRFEVDDSSGVRVLRAPRGDDELRTLLGRPTPTVGREKEIAQLLAEFDECAAERTPCAVLVTGPPGTGKSRLRHELLSRLRVRKSVRAVVTRGDAVSAGSAFVVARQIVRRVLETTQADLPDVLHDVIASRLAGRMDANEARLTTEFLSELLGTPITKEPSAILRSARGDPRLMAEWQRRSFERWLKLEAHDPLVLVIEDLHWADLPTMSYLGNVLKEPDLPLMVLGLARPEVHDIFPKLWAGKLHELPLSGLGKRAAGHLVRTVLGDVETDTVDRLVNRADGNAFYLEELIRAVAAGHGDQLPDTVLAMAQARVEQLDPIARRLLRAASAFGERFWVSGVTSVVGTQTDVPSWLIVLEEQEVVARSREERFKGEPEYTFRHALMRDAAYATLTADDRVAAHRGAARWLEAAGEADPLVMADQLEKGGEPEKAVPWLITAANAAYDGRDPVAARARAQRGAAYAQGEELGQLKVLEGAAAGILGDYATGVAASKVAVGLLPKGTSTWLMAISNMQYFGLMSAAQTEVSELLDAFADLPPARNAGGLYAMSLVRIVYSFSTGGRPAEAKLFLQRIEDTLAVTDDPDPSFLGWRSIAKVYRHAFGPDGDPSVVVAAGREAVAQFDELRDGTAAPYAAFWLTVGLFMIGRLPEAAALNDTALRLARVAGNAIIVTQSEMFVPYGRALISDSDDDIQALERIGAGMNPFFKASAAALVGHLLLRRGEYARAIELTEPAVGKAGPYVDALALSVLTSALAAAGRHEEALAAAARADTRQTQPPLYPTLLALARCEALMATGRRDEAMAAIRAARDRIVATARGLTDAEDRASWLGLQTNARTLALAKDWLGESEPA